MSTFRLPGALRGFGWLIVLLIPLASHAHNGEVLVAHPVRNIVIDGDFSDWPPECEPHALSRVGYGDPPVDGEDLQAWWRVGSSPGENALYVAVEVRDQSLVIDGGSTANWDTQDGCDLYVDLKLVVVLPISASNSRMILLPRFSTLPRRPTVDRGPGICQS